jgi:hypothetical protein
MLIYFREKSRLDINKLVKAANQVKTQAVTRVTTKMVFKYLTFILSYLQSGEESNNEYENEYKDLDEEIKRYSIMLRINLKERFKIKKFAHLIMNKSDKLSNKRVDKVASSIIYVYLLHNGAELSKYNKSSLKTKLKITPYVISNILPLIMEHSIRRTNVSIM